MLAHFQGRAQDQWDLLSYCEINFQLYSHAVVGTGQQLSPAAGNCKIVRQAASATGGKGVVIW